MDECYDETRQISFRFASTAGGETTQAPTVAGQYVTVQDFSPARSELLVTSGVLDQPQAAVELWAQPVPAGAPHRVGDVLAKAACWMPGGSYIVYARRRDLYAARSDESEARKLVTMSGFPFAIRVSPHLARVYFRLGQTGKSLDETLESLRLDPSNAVDRTNLISYYIELNRFEEARKSAEEAQAKGFDSAGLRLSLYWLAFVQSLIIEAWFSTTRSAPSPISA